MWGIFFLNFDNFYSLILEDNIVFYNFVICHYLWQCFEIFCRYSPNFAMKIVHSATLTCLFRRKSYATVSTRSSLLSSLCKNINVAHYSKCIKDINTKLGILAHYDKVHLLDKGHNSYSYSFGVMPLFYLNL